MKRFAQFRTLTLSAVTAASAVLCLGVLPAFAAATWTNVRTAHFLLVGDADEKDIRAVAIRLEQVRGAFRQLLPGLKLPDAVETRIIVFRNAASYRDFKPKRSDGAPDDTVEGFFAPGDDVNYITLSVGGERSDPLETAAHEYFHSVLDASFRHREIPPWLNEGLAGYFQTVRVQGDGGVILGTPRIESFNLLRRSRLIPLGDLVGTDPDQLASMADQPRSLFYAEAAALVHLLMRSGPGSPQEKLNRFISLLGEKETGEQAFEKSFQQKYAAAETALRGYLDPKSPPAPAVAVRLGSVIDASASSATLPEPEKLAYLGDLLGHLGETEEADRMLRKAVDLDANSAAANASLGMLLLRKDRFAEARLYLERAASNGASCMVLFNYAYALSREGADAGGSVTEFPPETAKRMRAALQRAISLDPDFAESYRLLAFVDFVNGDDLGEAVDLLKKGLSIRPGEQDFETLLAQVLLRQEKYAEAKETAAKVRKTATDERLLADADEVLRAVDEYNAVKPKMYDPDSQAISIFPPLLLMKRSSVTEADIARFEEDRQINNLNRVLERPRSGEKQIVGRIESVSCKDEGIGYTVRTSSGKTLLTGSDFEGLRMSILTEGHNSYNIDCGTSFTKQLTVLTYRPSSHPGNRIAGRLTGITFVPDNFRLKSPEELAKARLVVVEDDTRRSSRREQRP